jgi:hypothetical protein
MSAQIKFWLNIFGIGNVKQERKGLKIFVHTNGLHKLMTVAALIDLDFVFKKCVWVLRRQSHEFNFHSEGPTILFLRYFLYGKDGCFGCWNF